MRESSYYAEQFFPEHGIRYLTIADHFDNARENVMAPFQFAMNEVYLRDGSRKVKEVLRSKRGKRTVLRLSALWLPQGPDG